jgi:formylglycine-generating enzyme required for sulfatase activity
VRAVRNDNAQYSECVNALVCKLPSPTRIYTDSNLANRPLVFVTWDMATTYCDWRGARLPTEAEWEKAARGAGE